MDGLFTIMVSTRAACVATTENSNKTLNKICFLFTLDYAYGCHINCVDMDFSTGQRLGEFGIIFLWIARFEMD